MLSVLSQLDICGHSGDEIEIPFVSSSRPLTNDKERLDTLKVGTVLYTLTCFDTTCITHLYIILQRMAAHTQFSSAGDHTVEATRVAIKEMSKGLSDENFVIVISDANFSRYWINPKDFAAIMTSDPSVNVFAIFIGSLGDQAKK